MATESDQDRLVVVGASTGGIAALLALARTLPAGFPAPICVVQHIGTHPSILPELLSASGPHPSVHAADGQRLRPGVLHVAPPDHHLLVDGRELRLTRGPRENHTRPAIDPLFRSAALTWGARVIGVVLSGAMDDGTAGLGAIKDRGGVAIVQDPETAEQPDMPASALANVDVDASVAPEQLGPLLSSLVAGAPGAEAPPRETLVRETAINREENMLENLEAIAEPAGVACPDCGGGLWEVKDCPPLRYRCHTGHAFTALSLEAAQEAAGEVAIRAGVRALQEREMLLRRMAAVAEATGDPAQAEAARRQADRLRGQVAEIRTLAASAGRSDE